MNREDLEQIPEQIRGLLALRYAPTSDFDLCPTEELEAAARYLRAASYSALEGARKLERFAATRRRTTEKDNQ